MPVKLDPAAARQSLHQQARIAYWNRVAVEMDYRRTMGRHYHRRLAEVYRHLIPPGGRILEIGCARGDLLAALEPAFGIGVDFSPEMLKSARQRHPQLQFIEGDAHDLRAIEGPFDAIILSDLVNDLWDVQAVLGEVRRLAGPRTRLLLNFYSRLWELPLAAAQALGLARPVLRQNWLTVEDVADLLDLADFEVVSKRDEVLFPLNVPLLSVFANRWLAKVWPFRIADLTHFIVARPRPRPDSAAPAARVSVIIPARNEAGNIAEVFERVPEMGAGTEMVFVEGHSSDDTRQVIEQNIAAHPERRCQLLRQTGRGKADAVRLGFAESSGDLLMILDADLSVPPEQLPRFCEALTSGKAEFINGVRLVYPMEKQAMRFFNLVGNKFFSLAFSWLLGRPIKDTLCGTKALWRADYELIARNRAYFGEFDPFGDFDLLFGAARLNLKIVDLPVRYAERTYGTTNIRRWSHGARLLRILLFAARRIKFI